MEADDRTVGRDSAQAAPKKEDRSRSIAVEATSAL